MRVAIILLLLIPVFAHSQVNRSAKELAGENIETYLKKIFKNHPHNVVSLDEPQPYWSDLINADWTITCRVSVGNRLKNVGHDEPVSDFKFYLDRKMQVVSAEAFKHSN